MQMAARFKSIFTVLILMAASACDPSDDVLPVSDAQTGSCATETAIIQVYDGPWKTICGCQEGAVLAQNGQTLHCTFAAGTSLQLEFINTQVTHQMQINGIGATPIINPASSGNDAVRTYGFTFDQSGTYSIKDLFVPGMNGEITVL